MRVNPIVVLQVTNQYKPHFFREIQNLFYQINFIGNEIEGGSDQLGNAEENHDNIILALNLITIATKIK